MSNVNREVLSDRVIQALPDVLKKDVRSIISRVFEEITQAVTQGETVVVTGFGRFTPRVRAARKARNLKTGEPMDVGPKTVVSFKAGASLKASLNAPAE